MTEEDTFNKLRQSSLDEAIEAWQTTLRSGQSVQHAIEAIKKLGWTHDAYCRAWNALHRR